MHGNKLLAAFSILGCALTASAAGVDEPVRRIDVYVTPYYSAGQPPTVRVGAGVDALLASDSKKDIFAARDAVQKQAATVTPMTMMALAIRLYDVGERDEGLFWFYAAKDRFLTLARVVDVQAPALREATAAVGAFASLAGPYFNSYAFCDRKRQHQARLRAVQWVQDHPYEAMKFPALTPLPGDMQQNLAAAIKEIRAGIEKEKNMVNDPEEWDKLQKMRKQNHVDEQFCWKD